MICLVCPEVDFEAWVDEPWVSTVAHGDAYFEALAAVKENAREAGIAAPYVTVQHWPAMGRHVMNQYGLALR
jgi:hypothetical protein